MDDQERTAILQSELARLARDGWVVQTQTPFTAQLTRNVLQPTDRQLFVSVDPGGRITRVKPKVSGGYRLIYIAAIAACILLAIMLLPLFVNPR